MRSADPDASSPGQHRPLSHSPLKRFIFAAVSIGGVLTMASPTRAQRLTDSPVASVPEWLPPIASLVVPGSGQLLGRQERGIAYLLAEAFLAGHAVASLREAHRERNFYRDLAFLVARADFTPSVRDTTFQYFEQMAAFIASGPFDTDPGPNLAPPTDPTTFNGSVWKLARETFFLDPDQPPPPESPQYRRALDFYRSRAVGPGFEWSWGQAPDERARFRTALEESDDAFRRGGVILGFVVVNHLASAVDAYITGRLRTIETGLQFDSGWDASGVTAPQRGPVVYWKLRVAF